MDDQRGLDRIVFFSDAVAAIAVTLLVLPLVDTASGLDDERVSTLLSDNANALLAFVLSFLVIARFWEVHHTIWTRVRGYDRALIWTNFIWLLSIAFLPFPTEVLGATHATDATAATLYIGTMAVTAAAATVEVWLVVRTPTLQVDDEHRDTLTIVPALSTAVALLVAAILAAAIPGLGVYALLLLFPTGWATRALAPPRNR